MKSRKSSLARCIGALVSAVVVSVIALGVRSWVGAKPVPDKTTSTKPQDVQAKHPALEKTVRPFLKQYCTRCHGARRQRADRRFDMLVGQITEKNLDDYQEILDQLNLGAMPPKESNQPPQAELKAVIRSLTQSIAAYHRNRKDKRKGTGLRRLNAREYRHTVRDLFHLNLTMFDPTTAFPKDETHQHFDNQAETLVMSSHRLQRYLKAADKIIDRAIYPLERPKTQTWTFRNNFRQQPQLDRVHRDHNGWEHITLYEVVGADKHEGAYGPIWDFRNGVPHDGWYEIRFKATPLHRRHPYDLKLIGTNPQEPFRLGIRAGNVKAGILFEPQPIEPLLAEFELEDASKTYSARIWLDAGYTPRFTFRNGMFGVRGLWAKMVRKYGGKQLPRPKRRGIVENRRVSIQHGKLPQIHIDDIEIKGPFYDHWPTKSQQAIFGDAWESVRKTKSLSEQQMRKQITRLASQAYRRPVRKEEIDRILRVINVRKKSGRSSVEAYTDGLKMMLCSPNFLYWEPIGKAELSGPALASRLSYFLWASIPDDQLVKLANQGELQKAKVLQRQIDQMLRDPRSNDFIEGFLDSWLTLRNLGATPPDRTRFPEFYRYDLQTAMRQETHLFTRHLIDHDLSLLNFLDSDFTFVNNELATFYGIRPPKKPGFHKVQLKDRRRGGLLGQASVLTVSANGIDTSPVVRGVWLLENVLGTPPSSPPPDVEPLDPDIRGATTIRDQLSKHRNNPTCYECHRKIDPLGFALENYDAIGGWRSHYSRGRVKGPKIDASGKLPNGESFEDVVGFKSLLVKEKDKFARAVTEKLLTYALGRSVTASDRPEVDRILAKLAEKKYGMRSLIYLVATSKAFRSN
ncbi:MAG: DUF1592 domain-containing protein [Gemmataceae bacterium]